MRISIITGGGSGIGAAVARRLAGPAQSLMLHGQGTTAVGLARLNSVAEECRGKGARVEVSTGDLAKAGAGTALVAATRAAFGPIETIVHAAGFADRREFANLPREALQRAFAVMAAAFHEIAAAALPDLTRSAQGRVVAVSSFGPHRFVPGATYPGSARREGRARGAGEVARGRACSIGRHRQRRDARLHPQGSRPVRRA
ncbi:short-subunit dehydrogenase [Bradyrhizobium sp. USDA 4502]